MIAGDDHFEQVAEAFSYKALIYDEFGKDHPNLQRMRRTVYEHVLSFIQPGACMLEINAGTGTDASFFASQGYPRTCYGCLAWNATGYPGKNCALWPAG